MKTFLAASLALSMLLLTGCPSEQPTPTAAAATVQQQQETAAFSKQVTAAKKKRHTDAAHESKTWQTYLP